MTFDAIIKTLRNGADQRLKWAQENRRHAATNQKIADDFRKRADNDEELARSFDLLADALATGSLTREQLREIVAAVNTGEAPVCGFEVDDVVNVCRADDRHWGARGIVTAVLTMKGVVAHVTVRFSEDLTLTMPVSWLMHHAAFIAQMDAAEQQRQLADAEPLVFDATEYYASMASDEAVEEAKFEQMRARAGFKLREVVAISDPQHELFKTLGTVAEIMCDADTDTVLIGVRHGDLGSKTRVRPDQLMSHEAFLAEDAAEQQTTQDDDTEERAL